MTTTQTPSDLPASNLGFDPDALRAKYRAERDKRLRARRERPVRERHRRLRALPGRPVRGAGLHARRFTDEVEVIVIGGGFGGLLAGARLRQAGFERHPPDREGRRLRRHLVLEPLPGRDVRRRVVHLPAAPRRGRLRPEGEYTHAPEILAHSAAIGRKFDLYRNACFQTEVTEMRWDEESARWIVSTNRGDRMKRASWSCRTGR